jgi:ACR3 family arsenite transporter
MSAQCETTAKLATGAPMSTFERYLTVWVFLCIVAGIALGQFLPAPFQALGRMEVARVNIPVGLLIWVMIIPMLVKVDFGALNEVKSHVKGIGVTLFVNWLVKPFSMALLGWIFIRQLFAPWLPADQIDSYIAGLILLAAAPCTAMVFVWSRLTNGDPLFTLSQVAVNDSIMVFAFAPIVGLLLGISAITVPWDTLVTSVVLYIVIPLALAQMWRKALLKKGRTHFDVVMATLGPWSISALLATLVLLFAFQGRAIIEQPLVIALLAVPILIQVFFNSALAYWLNRAVGEKHNVACPSALIGASNFFELAVAAAISLFGFESGAALATVVGVLIEVPVMLLVVKVVNASKGWYESAGSLIHPRRRLSREALVSDTQQFTFTLEQQEDFAFLIRFDKDIPPLLADEPTPLGHDAGPNPSRLLAASVANCLSASLLFALRKFKNNPGQITTSVTAHMERNEAKSACASAVSMW